MKTVKIIGIINNAGYFRTVGFSFHPGNNPGKVKAFFRDKFGDIIEKDLVEGDKIAIYKINDNGHIHFMSYGKWIRTGSLPLLSHRVPKWAYDRIKAEVGVSLEATTFLNAEETKAFYKLSNNSSKIRFLEEVAAKRGVSGINLKDLVYRYVSHNVFEMWNKRKNRKIQAHAPVGKTFDFVSEVMPTIADIEEMLQKEKSSLTTV